MRYLVGFFFVAATGLALVMGCGETPCQSREDCDDGNACTNNRCWYGACHYPPLDDEYGYLYEPPSLIIPCDLDGGSGFCIDGVCRENPCVRDDSCIDEEPRYYGCLSTRTDPDGTPCEANGVTGVCISYACSEHDPCEGVVCEGEDLCANDSARWLYYCDYRDDGVCKQKAKSCTDRYVLHEIFECTYGSCDPETGDCSILPKPDGTGCCLAYGLRCDTGPLSCESYCERSGGCVSGVCS
jgi:hypothetical protein